MGASSASDCVALQGRPVKGAPCGRVACGDDASATLDSPALPAVSGSYRIRHLYASAREPEGAAVTGEPRD
jgi:hypothetical protein